MLDKLWRSLSTWDTDDTFCCADREKFRPESKGRPPVPQAKPRQSTKVEEVADEGGEPPPPGTVETAEESAPAEEPPAPEAADFRRGRSVSASSLEGGARLPQQLPGYYQARFDAKAEESDAAESTSSDEDFDRELVEAGRAMKAALNSERKQSSHDDQTIVRRIDTALHDIVPESLQNPERVSRRPPQERDRKGSKQPGRGHHAAQEAPAAQAAQAAQVAQAASLGARAGAGRAAERHEACYEDLKEQLWQESRIWGPPPERGDPRAERELQRYREAVGARFERLRPGHRGAPIAGRTPADAVLEGVRRHHQHCEAVGRSPALMAGDVGVDMDAAERAKLNRQIRILKDDIPDADITWKSAGAMDHTATTTTSYSSYSAYSS